MGAERGGDAAYFRTDLHAYSTHATTFFLVVSAGDEREFGCYAREHTRRTMTQGRQRTQAPTEVACLTNSLFDRFTTAIQADGRTRRRPPAGRTSEAATARADVRTDWREAS